jgi:hypothetical protein
VTVATSPASPAERLAGLIDGLCAAVAAHGPRGLLTVPLLLLLWSRLRRMAGRARRLATRMASGEPLSTPRRARTPRSAPSRPYNRLPRGVLWLVRVVPATASGAAGLQFLLTDPEMAPLIAAPSFRRILNPLCRMLGVPPPPPPPSPPQPPGPASASPGPRGLDRGGGTPAACCDPPPSAAPSAA